MRTIEASVIYRPLQVDLRFLPEGPHDCGSGRVSWVAIQHGAQATVGSLNVLDLESGTNQNYLLAGRPGFAFPTRREGQFVVGLERHVQLFDLTTGITTPILGPVDTHTTGTIINDGVAFDQGLVFGCKDLKFAEKKAGLYFWRAADRRLFVLRTDQICSNGKKVVSLDGRPYLLDIDSPTKLIVAYLFDLEAGRLGDPQIVVDLRDGAAFPDGMIVTPDQASLVVALYNPNDVSAGETRQYSIATGQLEAVWTCPGSPCVTCPQWVRFSGRIALLMTTAVEHMTAEQAARHSNAGCLFLGETEYSEAPAPWIFPWVDF